MARTIHRIPPLVLALAALGCAGSSAPPAPSPGAADHGHAPAAVDGDHAPYTAADVAFMQGMIGHHGQALEMTALVPGRTSNETLLALAQRIAQTQRAEIARMSRWLEERGETVPDPAAYREHAMAGHDEHGGHMPGMLTADEMAALAAATGARFDRLFLESMIRHHEGALTMVAELQAAGGGLEPQIYILAADVDADQRAEIARMQSLLTRIP